MNSRLVGWRVAGAAIAAGVLFSCQPGEEITPPGNTKPTATIITPAPGSKFSGGKPVSYSGSASDPEDGPLPASQFTWWVELHHATHTHPFMPPTSGATSGTVHVPPRGHPEDNIFLRIYLAVVDADGAADTAYAEVHPNKATLSFASVPVGARITLDGQPHVTPFSVLGVAGMERDLGAPTPQVVGPDSLVWVSWSDAGAASHTVVTPGNNSSYTATYQVVATVNQHPTVSVTAPSAGASIIQGTATSVTATAADADGNVGSVAFYDGATLIGSDNTAPYAVNWTPAGTGSHSLTARATDDEAATTTSAAVSVSVIAPGSDGTPPTVQLTSPTSGSMGLSGSLSLTATASDNVGVAAVAFQVDGVQLSEDLVAPYQVTLPATNTYASGVHVVRARARDAAGNKSSWSTAVVTFNGSALPAGFSRSHYVTGLGSIPTAMAFAPDGRLFIAEQGGALRVVKAGVLLSTPFVTVNTTADGERGLLGVAFHPQFATNHWVYVYYTAGSPNPHNRVARFTASGDLASGGETVLVNLPDLTSATNHNGGALHFGPDGKLYVAVGDNGTATNAQSMSTPFGKMLRFNDDGSIPASNPFYGSAAGINRAIWALGLRNPFTFAFQPVTGRMFINDVGESDWEEINDGQAGANYGWPAHEGPGGSPTYAPPIYAYGHGDNPTLVIGNAIVGAAFYGPAATLFPAQYQGSYFFADFANGWVNRLDTVNGNAVYTFWNSGVTTTDLCVGPDGALYLSGLTTGTWGVDRIGRP